MQERTVCCNWSSAWLFGGPKFESQPPLHHCTFNCMHVYFWEHTGTCSPDVGALSRGVQFEELTCEGQMPKPPLLSRYTVMSDANFSPYHGSARPMLGLIHQPLLSNSFSGVMNFSYKNESSVHAQRQREPCYKIWFKSPSDYLASKLHIARYHTILHQPIHAHISCICEPPFFCYKLCNPLTKSCPTTNPRPLARIPLSDLSIYCESGN
jgi:hypothetical protein